MNGEIFRENQTVSVNEQPIDGETNLLKYFVLSCFAVIVLALTIQLLIAVRKPSDYTLFEKFVTEWSAWSDCSPARVFILISKARGYRKLFNIFSSL